jgi:DNA-binding transcriptional MerR regulator
MKAVAHGSQSFVAPRKLFYRINEVAQMLGLKPYVLRYWETEFKELAPAKDASDQRRYRQSDIEVVLAIRKLLYEERYTIQGARARLREELKALRSQPRREPSPEAVPEPRLIAPARRSSAAVVTATASETATAPRAKADAEGRQLDKTLRRLRSEVNDLINLLSA